jgi:cell division protease FtsH
MRTVESAIDRVLAGPERKTRVMSDRERRVTAYHEGGHALVGHLLEHCDPIHKVSIVARGRALGWTLALPTEDRYTHTKAELTDRLAMLLGGRTAEEVVFGDVTTGAADDIDKATEIARAMVTSYGMSDAVGPIALGPKQGEVFLGKEYGHEANYSDSVAATIDREVRTLINDAHARAEAILTTYRPTLDKLAEAMLEHETLGDAELQEIFGDIETWVDPDPSGLVDAPPAPPEPAAPADEAPERAPLTAHQAAPAPSTVPARPTAERARWRLRWRVRPGASGT